MKRSNPDDFESSKNIQISENVWMNKTKKRKLSKEMFKVAKYVEPINEVIEISDEDERELSPADR